MFKEESYNQKMTKTFDVFVKEFSEVLNERSHHCLGQMEPISKIKDIPVKFMVAKQIFLFLKLSNWCLKKIELFILITYL